VCLLCVWCKYSCVCGASTCACARVACRGVRTRACCVAVHAARMVRVYIYVQSGASRSCWQGVRMMHTGAYNTNAYGHSDEKFPPFAPTHAHTQMSVRIAHGEYIYGCTQIVLYPSSCPIQLPARNVSSSDARTRLHQQLHKGLEHHVHILQTP